MCAPTHIAGRVELAWLARTGVQPVSAPLAVETQPTPTRTPTPCQLRPGHPAHCVVWRDGGKRGLQKGGSKKTNGLKEKKK
eukprot:2178224-Rhodomonas_salina.4